MQGKGKLDGVGLPTEYGYLVGQPHLNIHARSQARNHTLVHIKTVAQWPGGGTGVRNSVPQAA